jgi:geranylgeranyl diphosphate synthase type II
VITPSTTTRGRVSTPPSAARSSASNGGPRPSATARGRWQPRHPRPPRTAKPAAGARRRGVPRVRRVARRAADAAVWDVAAALELLHTAFVVHDDLIDRDLERRGIPNVAGRFRTRASLRSVGRPGGDRRRRRGRARRRSPAVRGEPTVACASVDAPTRVALLQIIDDAILVSASGELADVEHAARADYPETDALLGAAHDKTAAYSFEAPLLAGAVMAGATDAARAQLARRGRPRARLPAGRRPHRDVRSRRQAGRDPGADLREAKRTPHRARARHRRLAAGQLGSRRRAYGSDRRAARTARTRGQRRTRRPGRPHSRPPQPSALAGRVAVAAACRRRTAGRSREHDRGRIP